MKFNFLLIFLLISCTTIHNNGQYIDDDLLSNLNSNAKDKNNVVSIMGAPTFVAEENDRVWYYVSRKVKVGPLLKPVLKEQQIIKITFDKDDKVISIDDTLDKGRHLVLDAKSSFTYGKGESSMTHFIKNLGRFTKVREKKR